jgi:signal peptidase II
VSTLFKNFLFWQVALLSLLVDHLSKLWVVLNFKLILPPLAADTRPLWPGVFHFTYVRNPGAAFSWFAGDGWWLRWFSLVVSLGLLAIGILGPKLSRWEQAALGFLLGGAAGNGIDRFVTGEVVDFLDFRLIKFPIFNLADVFINIGLACFLISIWRDKRPTPASKS